MCQLWFRPLQSGQWCVMMRSDGSAMPKDGVTNRGWRYNHNLDLFLNSKRDDFYCIYKHIFVIVLYFNHML